MIHNNLYLRAHQARQRHPRHDRSLPFRYRPGANLLLVDGMTVFHYDMPLFWETDNSRIADGITIGHL